MANLQERYLQNLEATRIAGVKIDRYMRLFGGQNSNTVTRQQAQNNYKKACERWITPLTEEYIQIHKEFKK
jgi:uncharacterized protein YceH (UPF0502 family)